MDITFTPAARRFIRMMIMADGTLESGFRLRVKPGGCSGLSAEMEVAPAPSAGEQAVVVEGVRLFLDAESRLLLDRVTVDFQDNAASTGLVFYDPKQVSGCSSQGVGA